MEYFTTVQFKETVIIIAAAVAVLILVSRLAKKLLKSRSKDGHILVINIFRAFVLIFVVCVVLILLSINGIHIGKYVAGVGIVSAVAGFALQDPIKDIISGLTIILGGHFKVGDVVEYNGELGKVISLNMKTTWLFMIADERTLIIDNRNITEISRSSDWIDVDVPIGYDVDLHYSRSLCREAARRIERLRYVYSCDFLNTQELAESWILYRLRVHCMPEKKYVVRRNAYAVVQDVFYENNTEFPLSIKVIYDGPGENADHFKGKKVVKAAQQKTKTDYELGRGAANSKICILDGSDEAQVKVLDEAERYAVAENLDQKMRIRLRLLSEETVSMVHALTDINNGEFYIHRDGADYEICFDAVAHVSSDAHEKLVAVSSSGVNEAYERISGIIKKAIDSMVMKDRQTDDSEGEDTVMNRSIISKDDDLQWSYNNYIENQKLHRNKDDVKDLTDNLEMSVLTKFSDDIKIAVRANHVNIRILVKSDGE